MVTVFVFLQKRSVLLMFTVFAATKEVKLIGDGYGLPTVLNHCVALMFTTGTLIIPLFGAPTNTPFQTVGVVGWLFGIRIKYPFPAAKFVAPGLIFSYKFKLVLYE